MYLFFIRLPLDVSKGYELSVLEVKPGNAVSIIECDMNVEFAAPVGYKEPTRQPEPEPEEMMNEDVVDGYDAGFMVSRT